MASISVIAKTLSSFNLSQGYKSQNVAYTAFLERTDTLEHQLVQSRHSPGDGSSTI
jgi:hypothetical protein